MIRYNALPAAMLAAQNFGFRTWARFQAAKGCLYYRPGVAGRAGLRKFEAGEAVPAGWLRVTVGGRAAEAAWRVARDAGRA